MIRTDTDERIRRLKEAECRLNDIAVEIETCLRMSGLENRFGNIPDGLRSIASSNDSDSIRNLINELEYTSEEQPGWTRPLTSVKNVNRKDI